MTRLRIDQPHNNVHFSKSKKGHYEIVDDGANSAAPNANNVATWLTNRNRVYETIDVDDQGSAMLVPREERGLPGAPPVYSQIDRSEKSLLNSGSGGSMMRPPPAETKNLRGPQGFGQGSATSKQGSVKIAKVVAGTMPRPTQIGPNSASPRDRSPFGYAAPAPPPLRVETTQWPSMMKTSVSPSGVL